MTPPPPMPVTCGATAAMQNCAATAASTALPPSARMSLPASVHKGWSEMVWSASASLAGDTPELIFHRFNTYWKLWEIQLDPVHMNLSKILKFTVETKYVFL